MVDECKSLEQKTEIKTAEVIQPSVHRQIQMQVKSGTPTNSAGIVFSEVYAYSHSLEMPMLVRGYRGRSRYFNNYRPLSFVLIFISLLICPILLFNEKHDHTLFAVHLTLVLSICCIIVHCFVRSVRHMQQKNNGIDSSSSSPLSLTKQISIFVTPEIEPNISGNKQFILADNWTDDAIISDEDVNVANDGNSDSTKLKFGVSAESDIGNKPSLHYRDQSDLISTAGTLQLLSYTHTNHTHF